MKYLYYNGDSFCGDFIQPSQTFGQLLADKYNLKANHAWMGGSSNHRIYRTTVNYIMNNQYKLRDTLFLIGWTKPNRFELYDTDKKKYIRFMSGSEGIGSGIFQKEYITKFVDIDNMLEEHIRRVYSLECILKANNCKYLFYNVFQDTCILRPDPRIKGQFDEDRINFYYEQYKAIGSTGHSDKKQLWNNSILIFDWENWILPDISFDEYLDQFPRNEVRWTTVDNPYNKHPNVLGHMKWFEVVSNVIDQKNLYLL